MSHAKFRKFFLLCISIFLSVTMLPISSLIIISFYKKIRQTELIILICISLIAIITLIFFIFKNIKRFRSEESNISKKYQAPDAREKTYKLMLKHFTFLKGEVIENGDEIICSKTAIFLNNQKKRVVNQFRWSDWNYIKVELLDKMPFILLSKLPISRIDKTSIREFSGVAITNSWEMEAIIKLFSVKELDLSIFEELENEKKQIDAETVCFGKNYIQIPIKILLYVVVLMLTIAIGGAFDIYLQVSYYITIPICIFILWLPWQFFIAPRVFQRIKNAKYTISPISLLYSNGLLVLDFKWNRVRMIRIRGRKLAFTYATFFDSENNEEASETFYILNDKRLLNVIYAIREHNQLEFDIVDCDVYG